MTQQVLQQCVRREKGAGKREEVGRMRGLPEIESGAPSNWLGRQSRQELKDTCGQN